MSGPRTLQAQRELGREIVARMGPPPVRTGPRSLTRATLPEINLWELWAKGWHITQEECDALQADAQCERCGGRADECLTWLWTNDAELEPAPPRCCGRCRHVSLGVEIAMFELRARPLPMIDLIMRIHDWRPRAMRSRAVDGTLVVELHARDGDWHQIGAPQMRPPAQEAPPF